MTVGCLLLVAFLAATGCCSFSSRWNELAAAPPAPTAGDVSLWEGTWLSDHNGHNGKLRCIVSKIEPAEAIAAKPVPSGAPIPTHRFEFSATWGLGFVSDYTIDMVVTPEGDKLHFKGSFPIVVWPLIDDTYHTEGTIEGDQSKAKYHAEIDEGTFEMTRVK